MFLTLLLLIFNVYYINIDLKVIMHRSIGKRIRMDDPPPMEYDVPSTPGSSIHPSPMTPSRSDYQEHYNPYANYHNVQTPR